MAPPVAHLLGVTLQLWALFMFSLGLLYLKQPPRDRGVSPWGLLLVSLLELAVGFVLLKA